MQWKDNIRDTLKLSIIDLNSSEKCIISKKIWINIRMQVLKKYNYTCRYCGGRYQKYLQCIHLNGDNSNNNLDNLDVCCHLCYLVNNINASFNNEIELFVSKLSQLDIVRKTVDYIIKTGEIPKPNEIDKNISRVKISLYELSNLLIEYNYEDMPVYMLKFIDNCKIFFTKNTNIKFIESNICSIKSLFDDNDKNIIKKMIDKDQVINYYEFSKKVNNFLNNYFIN